MKFMMIVKGTEKIETGVMPDKEEFVKMDAYNQELEKAGMLIALDGFQPSSKGARVTFDNGKTEVKKGPFPHPEELAEGFWIIKANSMDDAIAWAKRIPFTEGTVEIRQIHEMSDFPPDIQEALNLRM